jgi:hypothetical protein
LDNDIIKRGWGGERQGVGRPKGASRNTTQPLRSEALRLRRIYVTPLAYMLGVINDPGAPARRRDEMAKAAAPYLHHRLTSIDVTGEDDRQATNSKLDISRLTTEELEVLAKILRKATPPDDGGPE